MTGWRLVRGAVVGLTATALALGGHVLAGGTSATGPSVGLAVGLAVVTVLLSTALSARRWTTGSLLTLLLGLQVVGHVALAHGGHGVGRLAAGHHPGHLTALATSGRTDSAAMLAAHLAAATLTALLLRKGEHWCWRLLELAAGAVRAARLGAIPSLRPWRAPAARVTYVVARAAQVGRAHRLRGPPAACQPA